MPPAGRLFGGNLLEAIATAACKCGVSCTRGDGGTCVVSGIAGVRWWVRCLLICVHCEYCQLGCTVPDHIRPWRSWPWESW